MKRSFIAILTFLIPVSAQSAVFTWKLGVGNATQQTKWSRGQNWDPAGPPTSSDSALFSNAGSTTVDVDASSSVNDLTFMCDALQFTFSGLTLTMGSGGITNNSSQPQTFNHPIALGATQTWNAATENIVFAGGISGANDLTLRGSSGKAITFSSGTTYSGKSIIKNGATLNANANTALANTSQIDLDGRLNIQSGLNFATSAPLILGTDGLGNGVLALQSAARASFGALTVKGNSTINLPGATSGSITFTDADRTAGTLTINGWVDTANRDKIFVTGNATPAFLSNVHFTGFPPGGQMVSTELVPVPEPHDYAALVALALLLFAFYRRARSTRCRRERLPPTVSASSRSH